MTEWKLSTLSEVAEVNPTVSLKAGTVAKYVPMEYLSPFTRSISQHQTKVFKGGSKFSNGDTLLARITPCLENGKTAFVDFLEKDEIAFGSTEFIVIRENKGISDKYFLYYFSISPSFREAAIKSMTGTSGRQRVQTDLIANKHFVFPPLSEQKAIAGVLSSFDDKIDLLRRQNKTLEAIAQTIFKEWFIKFRIQNEELKIDKKTGLPEGWKQSKLTEAFEIGPFRKLKRGQLAPYLDMKGVPTQGHRSEGWYSREFSSGSKFINGDTLLARITPCLENGKTAFVDFLNEGQVGWGSTEFIVLRPKSPLPLFYGYLLARSSPFRNFAIGHMTGSSGRQRVPEDSFDDYHVAVAPDDILSKFDSLLKPIVKRLTVNANQIQTLSKLRNTLLPKLMKGEIRAGINK